MPAPLTFTVQVGSGVPAEPIFKTLGFFKNYGTAEEPLLYQASSEEGKVEVNCEFSAYLSQNEAVIGALYDENGKLLGLSSFPSGQQLTSVYGYPAADNVYFKVFALGADLVPLSEPLISHQISIDKP